ncbi:hypothetical protein PR048_021283 [Dryococelus australis]|uniref:DDE-1 domain-containing protein n=1 Tax=Dryococelus australis TaxID=614101 RepID=A0ABQ9GXU0_9NEOP|nr:hypothetical protein PR048_021283 [Dryococelus australis]
MVQLRNIPRKIGKTSENDMSEAVQLILEDKLLIRKAAKAKDISFYTLFRYVRKKKNALPSETVRMKSSYTRNVFTEEQKYFKSHILNDASTGSLGLASQSGWLTHELFPSVMEHFIKNTNSSKENPSVLICDNHKSHLKLRVLDIAKEAGITMLTMPPHSSNKLQPLDITDSEKLGLSLSTSRSLQIQIFYHPKSLIDQNHLKVVNKNKLVIHPTLKKQLMKLQVDLQAPVLCKMAKK